MHRAGRAFLIAGGAVLVLLPSAQAGAAAQPPTFEVAEGAIDLDGTAWTWTGSALVVFGPLSDDGRPIRVYDPHAGEVRTSAATIPADGSHGVGRAVSVRGVAYLLGLPTYECLGDACVERGTDRVYLFDPATDSLETMEVEGAGAFMGAWPVAAGAEVYAAPASALGTDRIWRLDTESMAVASIEIASAAPRGGHQAAIWTGREIVLLGHTGRASENATWSNFLALDPIARTSRALGQQDFATAPSARGAAWDGQRILMVGARTSAHSAPDNQLVWLDPDTGELQLLGAMPEGALPAGLIFDGTRFLAVGSDGRCALALGRSTWIDVGGNPPQASRAGRAPVAVITVTPRSYSDELGQFYVEVDACSSTDDGILVRAEIRRDPETYWQEPGGFRQGTWLDPGEHRFTARVWDDEGLEGTTEHLLTLSDAPPDLHVAWTIEGLTIHADAAASTDQSGPITRFYWEWGDGTSDRDRAPNGDPLPPQPTISHTYTEAGTYGVTLIVTAPDGQASIHTETIVVPPASDSDASERDPVASRDVPTLALGGVALALLCASQMRRTRI